MKLLIPPESRRVRRARRSRRIRLAVGAVIAVLGLSIGALYNWPQPTPPTGEIYQGTDARVLASLRTFRSDHGTARIDVAGRIWTYLRLGTHSEAVLFVHGMGGAYDVWWQQMRALSDRYTVLSITYPAEPTLKGASAGIRGILDREGVARVHLVGTSMGGYVVQNFAAEEPERVASIVMSNTFPPGDWIDEEYGSLALVLPLLPAWVPQRIYRQTIDESIVPAAGGSRLVRGYLHEQSYRLSKRDFRARLALLRTSFEVADLEALGIPSLILESSNDPSVPLRERENLVAAYPGTPVVDLGEVGHFPYLNRPAAYTRVLEEFWTGLLGEKGLDSVDSGEARSGAPKPPTSAAAAVSH